MADPHWSTVEAGIRKDIEKAAESLQTPYLPLDQTENLRGQIVALSGILKRYGPGNMPIDGPLAYDVIHPPHQES